MKTIRMVCIVLVLAAFASIRAQAQSSDMYQATTRVVLAGKSLSQQGFRFLDIGALFGTLLRPQQAVEETFLLRKGKAYAFIAGGDNDARGIGLSLYDSKGNLVQNRTPNNPYAVVTVHPQRTQRYRVVLRLSSTWAAESFCSMSVMTTDLQHSYEMRGESLLDVLIKLEASFTVLGNRFAKEDIALRFHSGQNTWLLMGAIMKPKEGVISDPKLFSSGTYVGVLVGEKTCSDGNLYIMNGRHQVIERGTDGGSYSFAAFDGGSRNLISLDMVNAYSCRPSLLVGAILRMEER